MNDDDRELLSEMLAYCETIAERIDCFSIDEELFMSNSAYFDMLLMPVFQIGELANALSGEFLEDNRSVPWHAVRGLRNIIAHDYGVVDLTWAWNTIQIDIPSLAAFLRKKIKES